MSEMLANQYFLARKFEEARAEFEKDILISPNKKQIQKKLVICYIQTDQVDNAVLYFNRLLNDDIKVFVNTHPINDDCPCPALLKSINSADIPASKIQDVYLLTKIAILWMYCDRFKSEEYFEELLNRNITDENLISAAGIISSYNHLHPQHNYCNI